MPSLCNHLLLLLFCINILYKTNADRRNFASEVESFFARDSISAATVARTTDSKNLFVAFPLNLKPRVIVTNRGHPLPQQPPPPPPPTPPPTTKPRAQRPPTQKTKRRQSLTFTNTRNSQDLFQVPFILQEQQQQQTMRFNKEQFPAMTIQHFPPRNPSLPSIRIPKQETFLQGDLIEESFDNRQPQPQQQQQFLMQTPIQDDILEMTTEAPKFRRPKVARTRPPKSTRKPKTTSRPVREKSLQTRKEIIIPTNNFKSNFARGKTSFHNASVFQHPVVKTTSAPRIKTPPPTLTKHLDEFFGGDQRVRVRTTGRPNVKTRAPLTVKTITKALSPGITVLESSNKKELSQFDDEELEDSDELLIPRQHVGINPQFVEFSSLTTRSATTMKPTITAWKGTPKIRTVVHPPPISLKTALSKQRVASRASTTPNPVKVAQVRGTRRRVVEPTTENVDFMIDTSHNFEDVPRVGPRMRTVVKKIAVPTGRTIAVANVQKQFFNKEEDDDEDEDEVEPEVVVSTAKTVQSRFKSNRDHFNSITSTQNTLIDKNNNPLMPRSQQGNWNDNSRLIDESFFKETNVRRPTQKLFNPLPNIQITRKKRPKILERKPLAPSRGNRFEPLSSRDRVKPVESDERDFEPVIRAPEVPMRITTPIQSQMMESSVEEDFPENQSYEDVQEYDDEDYEAEIPPPPPPPPTTRRPFTKPTHRKRPVSSTSQKRPIWNSLPKLSTRKPVVATQAPQRDFASKKPEMNKPNDATGEKGDKKCHPSYCQLPHCYCGGRDNPGGFSPLETPQMIVLTFDDAVNDLNWPLYQTLFFSGHTNPNGCPILTTLYVSHEWTDYGKVDSMYAAGHEIASHSISHGDGAGYSKQKWHDEIYGQKEILTRYGGVKADDIKGMRAPFLAIGGDKMFSMLQDDNFTYDSSVTILENVPPSWPYTLDFGLPHDCAIPPCPTKSYPGLWEIPMVSLTDLNGGHCSMGDSCSYSTTADGVYEMLSKNFLRHYESNRAPLGLFYHSSWFLTPHRKEGFLRFFDELLQQDDVYFITSMQLIEWMRNPTPLSRIKQFAPWQCQGKPRQPTCRISRECNVSFRGDLRSFRTCGECPSIYPWVGKTNV